MNFWNHIVVVLLALVGLATLAVILSNRATTPQVIQAGGNQFINAIRAATGPVSSGMGGYG